MTEKIGQITGTENTPQKDQYLNRCLQYSKVAGRLEEIIRVTLKEGASEELESTISDLDEVVNKTWANASEQIEADVAERGLENAFDDAITIATMESTSPEEETTNKWVQGPGLTLLGDDRCQELLIKYLEIGEKKDILTETLIKNIKDIDPKRFKEYNDFYDPEGFLVVQSTFIGLGLKDAEGENAKKIYAAAREKADLPETKVARKALSQVPGCEYVANRI